MILNIEWEMYWKKMRNEETLRSFSSVREVRERTFGSLRGRFIYLLIDICSFS
jgi:hypothetical protein